MAFNLLRCTDTNENLKIIQKMMKYQSTAMTPKVSSDCNNGHFLPHHEQERKGTNQMDTDCFFLSCGCYVPVKYAA